MSKRVFGNWCKRLRGKPPPGRLCSDATMYRSSPPVAIKPNCPASFRGAVREGDLRDENYRRALVKDVDVLCHAAAWSSLWGHTNESRELFLQPSLGLINAAKEAGVRCSSSIPVQSALLSSDSSH